MLSTGFSTVLLIVWAFFGTVLLVGAISVGVLLWRSWNRIDATKDSAMKLRNDVSAIRADFTTLQTQQESLREMLISYVRRESTRGSRQRKAAEVFEEQQPQDENAERAAIVQQFGARQ